MRHHNLSSEMQKKAAALPLRRPACGVSTAVVKGLGVGLDGLSRLKVPDVPL